MPYFNILRAFVSQWDDNFFALTTFRRAIETEHRKWQIVSKLGVWSNVNNPKQPIMAILYPTFSLIKSSFRMEMMKINILNILQAQQFRKKLNRNESFLNYKSYKPVFRLPLWKTLDNNFPKLQNKCRKGMWSSAFAPLPQDVALWIPNRNAPRRTGGPCVLNPSTFLDLS